MTQVAEVLTAAFFLALVNERLVGYFDPIWKRIHADEFKQYVSFLTGAGFSFLFQIDLVSQMIPTTPLIPWAGMFLTALIVGGGSNLLHDLWPK